MRTIAIQNVLFQVEQRECYFVFGDEYDVSLSSRGNGNWKWDIYIHDKTDKANIIDSLEGYSCEVCVCWAKRAGYLKEQDETG